MKTEEGGHFYGPDGVPHHFIERKNGVGLRNTTVSDARKHGWFPGVTEVLKILNKPGLEAWKARQTAYAVLTSPRRDGEDLDAFITRVLDTDREQDQEALIARDLGTRVHKAITCSLQHKPFPSELRPYVDAVRELLFDIPAPANMIEGLSNIDQVVINNLAGYGGTLDYIGQKDDKLVVVDFKTCSRIPKMGSWWEHQMQTAAYAGAIRPRTCLPIRTANIYICTSEIGLGQVVKYEQDDWDNAFNAFLSLLSYWKFVNL